MYKRENNYFSPNFLSEKISEATRKYASLKAEMQTYSEHEQKPATLQLRRRRSSVVFFKEKENREINRTRKLHDLKLAFSEFYLSLILLQNYQTLNFTGFRKILKKHDKVCTCYYFVVSCTRIMWKKDSNCYSLILNLFANDKILAWSKLKASTDSNLNVAIKIALELRIVENQHFLLFQQCF